MMLKKTITSFLLAFLLLQLSAQESYFYPNAGTFNPAIPTPEQFLGYGIGDQHTRHDQLVNYFRELDRLSDRVTLEVIGKTFENRSQIAATFTSSGNIKTSNKSDSNTLLVRNKVQQRIYHW